jgi:vacuolar-type H+-ATPase subunit I/STV1
MTDHNEEVGSQTDIETPDVDSHIDASQDGTAAADLSSVREMFGLPAVETAEEPDDQPADDAGLDDEAAPEDEEIEEAPRDKNGRYVKFNKEDTFVPEEEYDPLLRKGLNYDKVEGRAKTYESALERVAKLSGYKDHADMLANLDQIEQQRTQQEIDGFETVKNQLREQANDGYLDADSVEQFIKRTEEAIQYKESERQRKEQETRAQQETEGWNKLFAKYPDLASQVQDEGDGNIKADFLNPDMVARISRGYDPIDAYELVHRDNLATEAKKKTEQQILKQQRLNKRAAVETTNSAPREPEVPAQLAGAFSMFGLDPNAAKKYVKK